MILTSFEGLSVREMQALRGQLREIEGGFRVVKNSLVKLALEDAGIELPEETFVGTTAIGYASEDLPALAKAIVEVAREKEGVRVKVGMIEDTLYEMSQVEQLADLPPLPVLQAQLLGVLQAPARRIASAMAGTMRGVASALKAYSEKEAAVGG
jgi:large subunit ribosomal protein L10